MDTIELGEEIAHLAVHLEAAEYRLIAKIGEFDAAEGWAKQGAVLRALARLEDRSRSRRGSRESTSGASAAKPASDLEVLRAGHPELLQSSSDDSGRECGERGAADRH